MSKITAIIPTFNEEENIREALESVKFADEIMVVDSFSTDRTLDIVREYTSFIIQREYENSASQKNWAIPQATHEWILLVDADEKVTPELRDEIIETLKNQDSQDVVAHWIYRTNFFMGKQINYSGWQNDKVIRLFRKSKCRYQEKRVHAEIIADGKVGVMKNKLLHYTFKGMDETINKINKYAEWKALDYDKKTGRLSPYHFVLKPMWAFVKHLIIKQGFRDGVPGFTIAKLQSYSIFIRYTKLWLFRQKKHIK